MDAGGVKDTTKQKFKGINGTFPNHKYFYEWKSNEILKRDYFLFFMSKIGNKETKYLLLCTQDVVGKTIQDEF